MIHGGDGAGHSRNAHEISPCGLPAFPVGLHAFEGTGSTRVRGCAINRVRSDVCLLCDRVVRIVFLITVVKGFRGILDAVDHAVEIEVKIAAIPGCC